MKLYLVTCVARGYLSCQTLDVYVVATNSHEAQEKAIGKMKELNYKYQNRVDKIVLVATTNTYGAEYILVE